MIGLGMGLGISGRGVTGGGGVAAREVYAFLNAAGTAGAVVTPTSLNAGMLGATPGAWEYGPGKRSGVVLDPTSPWNQLKLRAETMVLKRPIVCDGTTVTEVNRFIRIDEADAGTESDYEVKRWEPGETISGDVMVDFYLRMDRSLGADTGGTSQDLWTIYFGGDFAALQLKIDAGTTSGYLRAHGGAVVPIEWNTLYHVFLRGAKSEEATQFAVVNHETDAFVGAGQYELATGNDLANIERGNYHTNGDGWDECAAPAFSVGVQAVFPAAEISVSAPVLSRQQVGVNAIGITIDSTAIGVKIERSSGGAFATIEENYVPPGRQDSTVPYTYTDSTVVDAGAYTYRVSGTVGNLTGTSATTMALTVNNAAFLGEERDFFTDYSIASTTEPDGEYEAFSIDTTTLGMEVTQVGIPAGPGQYEETQTINFVDLSDSSLIAAVVVDLQAEEGVLWTDISDVEIPPGTECAVVWADVNYNRLRVLTIVSTNTAGGIVFNGVPGFANRSYGVLLRYRLFTV